MTGEHLVHGTGTALVAPDWPPLTSDEVDAVLAHYPDAASSGSRGPRVRWRSPRPLSAAALVETSSGDVVLVKRHHRAVRTAAGLGPEHAFVDHLRRRGLPVPAVLRTTRGASACEVGQWTYEIHERGSGVDVYRDATSWTPPRSGGHAREAGAALARLHRAAAGFDAPARPERLLVSRFRVFAGPDPSGALEAELPDRPALAAYLGERDWRADLARWLLPAHERLLPHLDGLGASWAHGDWHVSNLLWTGSAPDGRVSAVVDFGLADRTSSVFDLATALERNCVPWLDLPERPGLGARLDLVDALLEGYESELPHSPAEAAALAEMLPIVHAEFALSEVEYFSGVLGSGRNADVAYDDFLIGHAAWFTTPAGVELLDHLRRAAA